MKFEVADLLFHVYDFQVLAVKLVLVLLQLLVEIRKLILDVLLVIFGIY